MRSSILLFLCLPALAAADELRLDARRLFDDSTNQRLRLHDGGIELAVGELIEDDGPAAGYSYLPNEEKLSDTVWIKKELIVDRPEARQATLLVGTGGNLQFRINGQAVELNRVGRPGNYWDAYDLPVKLLRAGKNEIVIHGNGRVWIARAEDFAAGSIDRPTHPNRSARSSDAGKTWDYDRLGPKGEIDGEYYVRLLLDHHFREGTLTTPVIDAGNLAGLPIAPPLTEVGPVQVGLETTRPADLKVLARSGATAAPDRSWTDWQDVAGGQLKPAGRFIQLSIRFTAPQPLASPRLTSLTLQATPRRPADWTKDLRGVEMKNERIVRTSIPFQYEPFDEPKLKELRERYRLDEVVKGAKTDVELISKLAVWSAKRWDKGHLKDIYPAWDALAILEPYSDGLPTGGFCQHYNLVLLQACASFGLPGRAVSIGTGDHEKLRRSGHEVVEIWSNDLKKWVYIDGNCAWYMTDPDKDVPLSLFELRQRQLAALQDPNARPVRPVTLAETRFQWNGLLGWPGFLELRLIPRSNFLEAKAPVPFNQGMRGWFWTGHRVFSDDAAPASMLYSQRVIRPGDWNWTLNQAQLYLEATGRPGVLRVHADTVTPSFAGFFAVIDGQPARPVESGFTWTLKPGRNQLSVRPRNSTGREGIASTIVLER